MFKKNNSSELVQSVKKWFFYVAVLLFITVLECSKLLTFYNIKPSLVFSLAIGFFAFNSIKESCVFAVVSGFFMDCFSERALGFSSLFLLVSCIIIIVFCKKFIKIKFLNFILINLCFFTAFKLINFIIMLFSLNFKNIWPIWLYNIFPTCVLTILLSPIFYFICKQTRKSFNKKNLATLY